MLLILNICALYCCVFVQQLSNCTHIHPYTHCIPSDTYIYPQPMCVPPAMCFASLARSFVSRFVFNWIKYYMFCWPVCSTDCNLVCVYTLLKYLCAMHARLLYLGFVTEITIKYGASMKRLLLFRHRPIQCSSCDAEALDDKKKHTHKTKKGKQTAMSAVSNF